MAVESEDDISLTSNTSALRVPDTFNPSLICMAVESEDDISLTSNTSALRVPDTFNPSLICMAVESAEEISLVTIVLAVVVPVNVAFDKVLAKFAKPVPTISPSPSGVLPSPDATQSTNS